MRLLLRALMVSAALAAAPALAQNASQSSASSGTSGGDLIGPPQLSNFSLRGKVTQPAAQPAAPQANPSATSSRRAPRRALAAATGPAASRSSTALTRKEPPEATPARHARATRIQAKADLSAPQEVASGQATSAQPQSSILSSAPATALAGPTVANQSSWLSNLMWLLAAAAAAGAAAWYFLWQRPRSRLAVAGSISTFDAPSIKPVPPPAPPRATPRPTTPPQPKPAGIVSTRLRPWLDLQFTPRRIVVDEEKAMIEFELALFNSGNALARDILVEGALFNAGPMQEQQIGGFFQNPVGEGQRVPLLAPLQRLDLASAIILPRSQLHPLEFEGRPLFVPLAAFNALYRWGTSSGQTSASYLVGKVTSGEKLAPFRLDLAPRVFRRLAGREHEIRVRK